MSAKTHPFFDMHTHGFVRVATATPRSRTADVRYNVQGIIEQAEAAHAGHVDLLLFPELCDGGMPDTRRQRLNVLFRSSGSLSVQRSNLVG